MAEAPPPDVDMAPSGRSGDAGSTAPPNEEDEVTQAPSETVPPSEGEPMGVTKSGVDKDAGANVEMEEEDHVSPAGDGNDNSVGEKEVDALPGRCQRRCPACCVVCTGR